MFQVIMLLLPVIGVVFFVVFKLPPSFKEYFYKIPIWITSTLFALILGHMLVGVMAIPAAILMDIVLMPAFMMDKKIYEWSKKKKAEKQEETVTVAPQLVGSPA